MAEEEHRRAALASKTTLPRVRHAAKAPELFSAFYFFCLFLWVDGLAENVVQSFVRAYARKRAFSPRDEKENCVRRQLDDGVRNLLDLFQFSSSRGETREHTGNPRRTPEEPLGGAIFSDREPFQSWHVVHAVIVISCFFFSH